MWYRADGGKPAGDLTAAHGWCSSEKSLAAPLSSLFTPRSSLFFDVLRFDVAVSVGNLSRIKQTAGDGVRMAWVSKTNLRCGLGASGAGAAGAPGAQGGGAGRACGQERAGHRPASSTDAAEQKHTRET